MPLINRNSQSYFYVWGNHFLSRCSLTQCNHFDRGEKIKCQGCKIWFLIYLMWHWFIKLSLTAESFPETFIGLLIVCNIYMAFIANQDLGHLTHLNAWELIVLHVCWKRRIDRTDWNRPRIFQKRPHRGYRPHHGEGGVAGEVTPAACWKKRLKCLCDSSAGADE